MTNIRNTINLLDKASDELSETRRENKETRFFNAHLLKLEQRILELRADVQALNEMRKEVKQFKNREFTEGNMTYKVTDLSNNQHCGDFDSLEEAIRVAKEMTYGDKFKTEVYHYEFDKKGKVLTVTDWKNR